MKTTLATPAESDARIVVTAGGHQASAPATPLAPKIVKLGRILVPLDFSEHSLKALHYAQALAAQFGAELLVVNIVEQVVYPGDWSYLPVAVSDFAAEKRQEILEKLTTLTANSAEKVTPMVRLGRAWQEIVQIAEEQKADLIVIATHGYTGLKHALLGSVAEKVVRHAPCPVLTVRPDERDFL